MLSEGGQWSKCPRSPRGFCAHSVAEAVLAALHHVRVGTRRSSIRHRHRREAVVAELIARDGERCWYCYCRFSEGGRALTLDHTEPLADGGRSSAANLRLACRTCNRRKGRMG